MTYMTTEAMQEYDYDYARYAAQDGREAVERYVSEDDYVQGDRDADESCARGEHTLLFALTSSGRLVWTCEDCR